MKLRCASGDAELLTYLPVTKAADDQFKNRFFPSAKLVQYYECQGNGVFPFGLTSLS